MDQYLNEDSRRNFSSVSFGFGIASMITSVLLAVFPYAGMAFGCFAIVFSFISKGYYYKRDTKALLGMIFGIIGLVISISFFIFLLAFTFSMASSELYSILPEMDRMLGDTYMQQFGFMPSELIKYIFSLGGIFNV